MSTIFVSAYLYFVINMRFDNVVTVMFHTHKNKFCIHIDNLKVHLPIYSVFFLFYFDYACQWACLLKQFTHYTLTIVLWLFNVLYRSLKDYFYRQYIRKSLVNFKVENKILHRNCYGFLSLTCKDDQNELSSKTFEQTLNVTIKRKKYIAILTET